MKLSRIIISAGLIIALASMRVNAQVGVLNDPPSWIDVEIDNGSDYIYIHLAIKDLNGWDNIYYVNFDVNP